jgi:hypothetical protein
MRVHSQMEAKSSCLIGFLVPVEFGMANTKQYFYFYHNYLRKVFFLNHFSLEERLFLIIF